MAEESVDKLQIEIEANADEAADSMSRLEQNIKKLKEQCIPAGSTFAKLNAQLEKILECTKPFRDAFKGLDDTMGPIKRLKEEMRSMRGFDMGELKAIAQFDRLADSATRSELSMFKARTGMESLEKADLRVAEAAKTAADSQESLNRMMAEASSVSEPIKELKKSFPETAPLAGKSSTAIPTKDLEEYIKGNTTLEQLNKNLANTLTESKAVKQALNGAFSGISDPLDRINYKIENQQRLLDGLRSKYNSLSSSMGADSMPALKLERQILSAESAIDRLIKKSDKMASSLGESVGPAKRLKDQFKMFTIPSGFKDFFSQLKGTISSAASAMKNLNHSARSASTATKGAFANLGRAMKNILIFSTFYRVIGGATSAVADGIHNIAQASEKANSVFSGLSTSTLYLKNALSSALLPAIQAIQPALSAFIDKLAQAFNMIGMVTARLFGNATTVTIANKAQVDYAQSLGETAKQTKSLISGFDELNILQKKSTTAGMPDVGNMFQEIPISQDAISVADRLSGIFDKIKTALQPTLDALERLWDQLKVVGGFAWQGLLDFYEHFLKPVGDWALGEGLPRFVDALTNGLAMIDWQGINDSLIRLWDALAPFAINVGEGLLWFWENVAVPMGVWTANEIVPRFLNAVAEGIDFLNIAIDKAKPAMQSLWDNFLKPLGEYTGGVITEVFDSVTGSLRELYGTIKNSKVFEDMKKVFDKLLPVLKPVAEKLIDIVGTFAKFGINNTIKNVTFVFEEIEDAIGAAADVLSGDFMSAFNHLVELVAGNTINRVIGYFGIDKIDFSGLLSKWEQQIAGWWDKSVKPWFSLDRWKGLLSSIPTAIGEAIATFKENWIKPVTDWWDQDVAPWFTLDRWGELMYSIGYSMADATMKFITAWTETIPNWWDQNVEPWFHLERWQKLVSSVWESIKEAVAKFKEEWVNPITAWWNEHVVPLFDLDEWKNMVSSIWKSIKESVTIFIDDWKTRIKEWWDNDVVKWFDYQTWLELGKSAIAGLMQGIKGIWDAAKELGGDFVQGFKDALGIHSPSKEMEDAGNYINQGLANGITGNLGVVNTALQALVESIRTAMQTAFNSLDTMSTGLTTDSGMGGGMFYQFGYQFMTDLSSGITAGTPLAQTALVTTANTLNTDITTLFGIKETESAVFNGYGVNLMQGLANGITTSIPLVSDELALLKDIIDEQYRGYMDGFQEIIIVDLKKLSEIYGNTMDVMKNTTITTIGTMMSQLNRLITRIDTAIKKLERLQDMGGSLGGKRSGGSGYSSDYPSSGGYSVRSLNLDGPSPYGEIPALADGSVVYDEAVSRVAAYQSARPSVEAPQNTMEDSIVAANGQLVGALYQMATMIVQAIEDNATEVEQDPDAMFKVMRKKAAHYKYTTGNQAF